MTDFTLYPAIDLRNGSAVRLYQGDYGRQSHYGDPREIALGFISEGAKALHLVDLDGAKEGYPVQRALILTILREVKVPVQVGGGIRSLSDMEAYLKAGVSRIILGTKAVEDPALIREALHRYGEQIAIGIDAKDGIVQTRGWLSDAGEEVLQFAERLADWGAETLIYTDIRRDGTLRGPNVEATVLLARRTKKRVIASGGISGIEDLLRLQAHRAEGIVGAIVGKALYAGAFTVGEALARLEGDNGC